MQRDTVLQILREHTAELHNRGVASLSVFGSVARNEAGPESDVDMLVEFNKPVGMFECVRLQMYLESLLGCRVDLVTPAAVRPQMREQIFREAIHAA